MKHKYACITRFRSNVQVDIFYTRKEAEEWSLWRLKCGFEVICITDDIHDGSNLLSEDAELSA